MSELAQRYQAVSDRIHEIGKIDPKTLTTDDKMVLVEELAQLGASLGRIALEKMANEATEDDGL